MRLFRHWLSLSVCLSSGYIWQMTTPESPSHPNPEPFLKTTPRSRPGLSIGSFLAYSPYSTGHTIFNVFFSPGVSNNHSRGQSEGGCCGKEGELRNVAGGPREGTDGQITESAVGCGLLVYS